MATVHLKSPTTGVVRTLPESKLAEDLRRQGWVDTAPPEPKPRRKSKDYYVNHTNFGGY